jgi:NADPH:quinone reductase-like Zn-dependent oxidoreductase
MSNQAAWLKEPKTKLQVDTAPMYKPKAGEVLIMNGALAINPVDWKIQVRTLASTLSLKLIVSSGTQYVQRSRTELLFTG